MIFFNSRHRRRCDRGNSLSSSKTAIACKKQHRVKVIGMWFTYNLLLDRLFLSQLNSQGAHVTEGIEGSD